ncbi:hypothetical protein Tco_0203305, partial [Tanacetum coccineum]
GELSDEEREDDNGEVKEGVYGDEVPDMDSGDREHGEDEGSRSSREIKVKENFEDVANIPNTTVDGAQEETHGKFKKNEGGDKRMGKLKSIDDIENQVGNVTEATCVSNEIGHGMGPGPYEELGLNRGIGLTNGLDGSNKDGKYS